MRRIKMASAALLAAALLFFAGGRPAGQRAAAAAIVDSGSCGEDLTWTLDSDGLVTVSGTGPMDDYAKEESFMGYVDDDGVVVTRTDSPFYEHADAIKALVVEPGVTSIGDYAFLDCPLTSITLADSVVRIGASGFDDTPWYYARPDGVIYCGKIVYGCKGVMKQGTEIVLNDDTVSIRANAFAGRSGLSAVTIPPSVTHIESFAFRYCTGLKAVHIRDLEAWRDIAFGDDPFHGGFDLYLNGEPFTELEIPEGETDVGYAFRSCTSLASVTIPESAAEIGDHAFEGCTGLVSVEIREGATAVGERAFYGCAALKTVSIPDTVTKIGRYAFHGCASLEAVTIPKSVSEIGEYAFAFCGGLASVTIRKGLKEIPEGLFYRCAGLTSVRLPESVTEIGGSAFQDCESLSSAIFPARMKSIGFMAFAGCPALTDVYYTGSATQWAKVRILDFNDAVKKAQKHFDYVIAHDHTWDGGEVKKPATAAEEGIMVYTCLICDETKEAPIPKLNVKPGDVDGDGAITSGDARLALRRSVSLESYPEGSPAFIACDVDGSGTVTPQDARSILRGSVGLEDPGSWPTT